ncbi:MAG: C4-dicarboxylate ABC transporter substrate-binding protein [Acidobacteria bacterium RIFCSPLOWO2_02_FULL_65_29]|nr:MAG: C4-dicarboxylate ABC transporter substrate-binding protein [Acidobacteria bacterium RIFCSPLOWO2_02_FULL_65_29]
MSPVLKSILYAALVSLAAPASAAEFVAKLASQDPPTTAKHRGLLKAAALVKERTKGAVEIQVFPSSQLGGGREMGEGVQLGTLEMMITPASFLGGFNPAVSIFDVPYVFPTDREQSRKLREGRLGQAVLESFRKRGFEPIALWSGGRKQLTSNKPLNNISAIAGQRFRVMDSKILIGQFSALGASAIVLPFGELYTALQTGVIDAQENPLDIIQKMKFFEVQKNLLVTDHGAIIECILASPRFMQRLPAAHRDAVRAAFREVAPEVDRGKEADAQESLAFFKTAGLNVRIAGEAERAKLRAIVYPSGRDAYLAQAGAEGKALIALYEKELKALAKK